MSGTNYFLDTNAVIALINGNQKLLHLTSVAEWVGMSVITRIEFLAFASLSQKDADLFEAFSQDLFVIGLGAEDIPLINEICTIRKNYKLKLPDAIIAASALKYNCHLITNDAAFKQVLSLSLISF